MFTHLQKFVKSKLFRSSFAFALFSIATMMHAQTCDHSMEHYYGSNGDGTHNEYCSNCGVTINTTECGDGYCLSCGYCSHPNYSYYQDGYHYHSSYCSECGEWMGEGGSCTDDDNDSSCDVCGSSMICYHGEEYGTWCSHTEDGHHTYCGGCGEEVDTWTDLWYDNYVNEHYMYCNYCGMNFNNEACSDNDGNNFCDICGNGPLVCDHNNIYYSCCDFRYHIQYCSDCGRELSGWEECIDNNGDNICDLCQTSMQCEHWLEDIYTYSNGDGTHYTFCNRCQETISIDECWYDEWGNCFECGYFKCKHNHGTRYIFDRKDQPSHHITCNNCGETMSTVVCTDTDKNNYCDVCGFGPLVCDHSYENYYLETAFKKHSVMCYTCDKLIKESDDCVDANDDNYCDLCGQKLICYHYYGYTYTDNHNDTHTVTCSRCGEIISTEEMHSGSTCACGYECPHNNGTWFSGGMTIGYHDEHCDRCGYIVNTTKCTDENKDFLCDICGYITTSSLEIIDGTALNINSDASLESISYTRTFNNTNWQALYVPFRLAYEDWKDQFEVAYINDINMYDTDNDGEIDATELEIIKVKSGAIEHGTPYLIKAKSTGKKTITTSYPYLYSWGNSLDCASTSYQFYFQGTYSGISGYEMQNNGYYALSGGSLAQAANSSVSLSPFRWYMAMYYKGINLVINNGYAIKIRVVGEAEEEETSVSGIAVDSTDDKMYSIDGREVDSSNVKRGIYIKNGKKIFVK